MSAEPQRAARRTLPEIDSTNAEALRSAPSRPTWMLALRQTAGRGRRGRPWAMPGGNFAATLARPAVGPAAGLALRSYAMALALRDALVAAGAAPADLALKWPNDVLLRGGKVAGILLESDGRTFAIGVGVNLAAAPAPAEVEPGAVPPVALGAGIDPEAFLDLLDPAFAAWEERLAAEGFAPVRAAWLAHAARLGERIVARAGGEALAGIFEGIDAEGHLLLATEAGRRALPAADIDFEDA